MDIRTRLRLCDWIDYERLGIRNAIARNNHRRRAMRLAWTDFRALPFRFEKDGVTVDDVISGRVDPADEPEPPSLPVITAPFSRSDELVDCLLEITTGMDPPLKGIDDCTI